MLTEIGPCSPDGRSRVYTLNLTTNEVNLFADSNTIDLATGVAVGGEFRNMDNLAIDAQGVKVERCDKGKCASKHLSLTD